jgi:hypothetical protein
MRALIELNPQCKELFKQYPVLKQQAEFIKRATVAVTIASKGSTPITINMVASAEYAIESATIEYTEGDKIGKGGFGVVLKAKWDGVVSNIYYSACAA